MSEKQYNRPKDNDGGGKSSSKSIPISMLASGMAEGLTMPLDTIKVHMQAHLKDGGRHPLMSSLRGIYAQNGIGGFYRSFVPSIGRQMLSGGIRLGLYEELSDSLGWQKQYGLLGGVGQGVICGVVASSAAMPLDLLKTRVQSVQGTPKAVGFREMSGMVWRNEGVRGFYRGYRQALERSVMISAIQMPTYFGLQNELKKHDWISLNMRSTLSVLGCTAATTVVIYPVDLCKTQVQARCTGTEAVSGTLRVMGKVMRDQGLRGLYRGCLVSATRALPQFWLTSLFYENLKKYWR